MNLLDSLIAQGMMNNAEFTRELIKIKNRVSNTPEKQAIKELQEVTAAMQNVDEFTLVETDNVRTDTAAMKMVDEFTLEEVANMNIRLTDLELKVNGETE